MRNTCDSLSMVHILIKLISQGTIVLPSVIANQSLGKAGGMPTVMDLIPSSVLCDSYKACHAALYPPAKSHTAYGEFRGSFEGDPEDHRILFFGLRYIVEHYVARHLDTRKY